MLRSLREINGYDVEARDGRVGKVDDFWFDDADWKVRYLVADTGGWLSGRRVPLAPEALGQPNHDDGTLPVMLTREQIRKAPAPDDERPVSRRKEERLRSFYGWPAWWAMPTEGLLAPSAKEVVEGQIRQGRSDADADPHLRSAREVTGYHIHAEDGHIGHVEDFIVDDVAWSIRYLVVDTRNVLPGKKVLLSPEWISEVRWDDESVTAGLKREQIREGPEYDPTEPINRRYEERLYDFYGRPKSTS